MSPDAEPEPQRRGPKAERSEATRAALVSAGRELFAERGYAAVGTEEVVQRAGVTRGALYHHFRDKRDLFRAVYEQVEQEVVESVAAQMSAASQDPWEVLANGTRAFLDACSDPALMRIGLLDGPAVLGWGEWREIGTRYALGLVTAGLQAVKDAGELRSDDVKSLAHLMLGTLGEAAMLVANADDPRAAREQVERALLDVLNGLRA
jgi:AcrR family transcriptional regulator